MLKIKNILINSLLIISIVFIYSCSSEEALYDLTPNNAINTSKTKQVQTTSNFKTSSAGHHYVGNLENVLGDVKQAQITNALATTTEVDYLLDGFEEMGVNGIRIAIFADNVNPNETMYDYLYNEAVARGFNIFANPAQTSGGQRIANGILNGATSPVNNTASKNALVTRIKAFAQDYECDWISPFNEDGKPGDAWYAGQINNVYSELYGQVNGADLIGSCTWGIPAGIEVLQDTNIENYITVSTTHNLGFNHSSWSTFISESGSLPVWDSETNNYEKFSGVATRIDAAIDAGVDGLVLYNSWNTISKTTGALNSGGQELKDKITQYYYIQNKQSGDRIKPYSDGVDGTLMVQTPTSYTGDYTQWEIVPTDNGYVRFKNKGSGMYFRPTNNNNYSNIYATNSFSGSGTYVQWQIDDIDGTYSYVLNRQSGKKMRSINGNDLSTHTTDTDIRINQVPTSWTGNATKWEFIKAN
ncbi:MAG: RICIN domain-containing protein [Polaribacter sp.]|uniref:RICIN domain-containing protein n=1 Tax=Polaribacter sp. TaxID=1920175 RepID=UPI0032656AF9